VDEQRSERERREKPADSDRYRSLYKPSEGQRLAQARRWIAVARGESEPKD
jgi:hypothetical protein